MIVELHDQVYDDFLGNVTPTPAWLCDAQEEAQYKIAMIGPHPRWEFVCGHQGDKFIVYGRPKN
jgi:hypothetical protein